MIVGITGGSGCGKTTLLNILRQYGALVLDCDEIYYELLQTDPVMLAAIQARFPEAVFHGCLDRKKLGAIVFSEEGALLDLNAITHTAVKREVLYRLRESPQLAAIDAIGLFEGGLAELCDVTVAVTAPVETRVRRLMARDGISEAYARSRIAAQHDEAWFGEKCDHVLVNDGDLHGFLAKCVAFLRKFGIMYS